MRRTPILVLLCVAFALASAAVAVPSNFARSLANILVSEGNDKYTNHPNDPGGPTKFGITIKDVRLYIDRNATAATVKGLTYEQAVGIYHPKYWQHKCVRADELPAGLDYSTADYAVNAGVGRAGVVLRRLLKVNADRCDVTDGLLALINNHEPVELIRMIADERRRFYRNLIANRPSLGVFRNGWMARADSVEKISLRMAGSPPERGLFGEEIETEPAFGPGKACMEQC